MPQNHWIIWYFNLFLNEIAQNISSRRSIKLKFRVPFSFPSTHVSRCDVADFSPSHQAWWCLITVLICICLLISAVPLLLSLCLGAICIFFLLCIQVCGTPFFIFDWVACFGGLYRRVSSLQILISSAVSSRNSSFCCPRTNFAFGFLRELTSDQHFSWKRCHLWGRGRLG